ncbi:triose-phosphate isomerase [Candidatus Campbellbacteria bacterium CG11_big_fil_rev_8_21_14_0_20_44_21]|uniref:Triosephosphate isomerase n=1 Tax=Candidatus Campbellbacteria bacterium CG22_combo_CG10-13_8_21_14_all_43_18 TaxID=1974530 RepID=A0A2H0DX90_9BACT|nr:MAG: triose-phosphate isomerase [Candidatus Campbellbacteria bacterium CG22_combo_CG10-13_8_21_14_all_43_18]PIR24461.1 MAG: triose-phosphate isomerase [Candidatus Campbellbacteria bacterium CG11_big_fil_rev_8_21_14_0_20_44_21]
MRKKYIIANWKMSPLSLRQAESLFNKIKKGLPRLKNVSVIICPPLVYLAELMRSYSGRRIIFGAQNSFWENVGPFTGELSPHQLFELGAEYVILGHSERRALGETNSLVNKKIKAAAGAGLNVVFCIGEKERDERGDYLGFIEKEIKEGLAGFSREKLGRLLIAYEPIWAIGRAGDEAASSDLLHQMKIFILKILKSLYGERGMEVPIIYGGASAPENARELLSEGEVRGLLVGHQSLIPENFIEIIKIADSLK